MVPSFLVVLVFFAIFLALGLVGAVVSRRLVVRRETAMQAVAARHGLTYVGTEWLLGDMGCSLFQQGYARHWDNIMTGAWGGMTVAYADYQYTTGEGRNQRVHRFSLGAADLGCFMPSIDVKPRGVVDQLEGALGMHELKFESDAFNQRFSVTSPDERFAFQLVDARMIEALLTLPWDAHASLGPERVIVWGQRRTPELIGDLLDSAVRIAQHVPEIVRHDYPPPPPPATAAPPV